MATQQQQQSKRQWIIWSAQFHDEDSFRGAVATELAQCEHIGYRLGRGIVASPIRQRDERGNYVTTGWLFEDIFVPAARGEQPVAEVDEPEPELPDLPEYDAPDEEPAEVAA